LSFITALKVIFSFGKKVALIWSQPEWLCLRLPYQTVKKVYQAWHIFFAKAGI
jgi:hypothetical protein